LTDINKIRELRHKEAVEKWKENNHIGTVEAATGFGKSKVAIDIINTCLDKDNNILILAPTTAIIDMWKNEFIKWKVNTDLYNITYMCYQSAYKEIDTHYHLVIADEIHNSLSTEYYKFYAGNKYDMLVGLSATIPKDKKELLDTVAPVCYTYTLTEGIKDGFISPYETIIVLHQLDTQDKYITAGTKANPFLQTEFNKYLYLNKMVIKARYKGGEGFIKSTLLNRMRFMYTLKSKVEVTKKILEVCKDRKTIIFSNSSVILDDVTDNAIHYRKTDSNNDNIIDKFNDDSINVIASSKKIKEGANLNGADTVILMSYNSTDLDFIQRIGRALRYGEDKIARIFIIVTQQTVEEKWFEKMTKSNLKNVRYIPSSTILRATTEYVAGLLS
jgi:superfamily II DNA or RNA helicase